MEERKERAQIPKTMEGQSCNDQARDSWEGKWTALPEAKAKGQKTPGLVQSPVRVLVLAVGHEITGYQRFPLFLLISEAEAHFSPH